MLWPTYRLFGRPIRLLDLSDTAVPVLTHPADSGFAPATSLLPIRRLALDVVEGADDPAAWLDVFARTLALV